MLIYLAEDLSDAERPEGFLVEHEEADMTLERVPLADAVQRVFDGDIRNASAVVGTAGRRAGAGRFAAATARRRRLTSSGFKIIVQHSPPLTGRSSRRGT